jgi:hypothetical protein
MYNILQAKIEFTESKLYKVTVLVDCTSSSSRPYSDVRAICADIKPRAGYMSIPVSASIDFDLLQKVAAAGMEVYEVEKIFPGWKKSLTKKLTKTITV